MTAIEVEFGELPEVPDFATLADPEIRRAVADELAAELREMEMLRRRCEARTIALLDRADRVRAYSIDGHRNVRSWAAATVNWSDDECRHRSRTVQLFRDIPHVGVELSEGTISVAAVRELARLRANPRCGDALEVRHLGVPALVGEVGEVGEAIVWRSEHVHERNLDRLGARGAKVRVDSVLGIVSAAFGRTHFGHRPDPRTAQRRRNHGLSV